MKIEPIVIMAIFVGSFLLGATVEKHSRSDEIEISKNFDMMITMCEKDLPRSQQCEIDYKVKVIENEE